MSPIMTNLTFRENVPMAPLTTWRVGGNARFFLEPTSTEELVAALTWADEQGLPWTMMGRGSNMLVADEGFPGLVIRFGDRFGQVTVKDGLIFAQAGASTMSVVKAGAQAGWGGVEFLSTIPGSIGGTVYMNAGAHGHCLADILEEATILFPGGQILKQTSTDLEYRYRHSNLKDRKGIVLDATIRVTPREKDDVQREISDLSRWRRERQPQALSAGSVFTNPTGTSAGKIIEDAGLKGLTIGKAQVSPVHANFIVNLGGATADDINSIIKEIQQQIHERHGYWLHPEVKGIGLTIGRTEAQDGRASAN